MFVPKDFRLVKFSNRVVVAVSLRVVENNCWCGEWLDFEVFEPLAVACGVDPGVVDGNSLFFRLLVQLFKEFNAIIVSIFLIFNLINGGKQSNGAGSLGETYRVKVSLGFDFPEVVFADYLFIFLLVSVLLHVLFHSVREV